MEESTKPVERNKERRVSRRGTVVYPWDYQAIDDVGAQIERRVGQMYAWLNRAADSASIPATPMQALMETAPNDAVAESVLEKQPKLEALRVALENGTLTEREVWVIEAVFWRGLAIRALAKELGISRSYAHRLKQQAIVKLREALSDPSDGQLDPNGEVPLSQ